MYSYNSLLALILIVILPIKLAFAEPKNFDIENGINPTYLNQSKKVFRKPGGISISPDGAYLLIADPLEGEIKIFDTGRLRLLSQFGKGELGSPEDIGFDRRGRLLVTDTTNHRIKIFRFEGVFRNGDPNVEYLSTLSDGFSSPNSVSIGTDGRIYVSNSGDNSIVMIRNGMVVKKVRSAGQQSTALLSPRDVHRVSANRVLVSDSGNDRMLVFDKDLNFIQELGAEEYGFNRPGRIASDDSGLILISDEGNNTIKIIDSDFKPKGRIISTAPPFGNLDGPHGIETVGRYMWVSDIGNNRVVLFKRE
jgi:DNA-binding beta-propeller fold protein YncE